MKTLYTALVVLVCCTACSKPQELFNAEAIVAMPDDELVTALLDFTNGDKAQLARMLQCSIATLERVQQKNSKLTLSGRRAFVDLYVVFLVKGDTFVLEQDPYFGTSTFKKMSFYAKKYVRGWVVLEIFELGIVIVFVVFRPRQMVTKVIVFSKAVDLLITVLFLSVVYGYGLLLDNYKNPDFVFQTHINLDCEILLK